MTWWDKAELFLTSQVFSKLDTPWCASRYTPAIIMLNCYSNIPVTHPSQFMHLTCQCLIVQSATCNIVIHLLSSNYNMPVSQTPPTTSPSSIYQSIFNNALTAYETKTGKILTSDPLLCSFGSCDSLDAVLVVLQEFHQSGNQANWLTK